MLHPSQLYHQVVGHRYQVDNHQSLRYLLHVSLEVLLEVLVFWYKDLPN